jgi:hypothetical protein
MLIEKNHEADPGVEDAFVDWWDEAKTTLASWDIADFFRLMTNWEAGRGSKDREFITSWIERSQACRNAQIVLADRALRSIVSKREDYVRPGKQRLRGKQPWKLPDGYSTGLYQMDYRHGVGRQIAMDIVEGLENGAV